MATQLSVLVETPKVLVNTTNGVVGQYYDTWQDRSLGIDFTRVVVIDPGTTTYFVGQLYGDLKERWGDEH